MAGGAPEVHIKRDWESMVLSAVLFLIWCIFGRFIGAVLAQVWAGADDGVRVAKYAVTTHLLSPPAHRLYLLPHPESHFFLCPADSRRYDFILRACSAS